MEALIASPPFFLGFPTSSSSVISKQLLISSSSNINFRSFRKNYVSSSTLSLSSHFAPSSAISAPFSSTASVCNSYWMVIVDKPPHEVSSKADIVDYYVGILAKVLGNEKDAQMSIYDASFDNHFGFCCHIHEDDSRQLARLPGVVSVKPEAEDSSARKNCGIGNQAGVPLFDQGKVKHWIVQIEKPGVGIVTKAQMVDHCVRLLSNILGNERDAQMCLYHVSWQSKFGFCCDLNEKCAEELAGVPGVLAVELDNNFESLNKDYGGDMTKNSRNPENSAAVQTKKLFVTGLSFYTSERTLRAAFEEFGELVEVKIIMDKISKRSKGYAFVEYTTEEAASAALQEMNGKIINGWMIVVDVAKTKPFRQSTSQPNLDSSY